jgi:hypothetical protein
MTVHPPTTTSQTYAGTIDEAPKQCFCFCYLNLAPVITWPAIFVNVQFQTCLSRPKTTIAQVLLCNIV